MLKFEGINNINDVEQYKGDYLYQERDHEDIELAENEYYYLTSLEVLYLIMTINLSAELSIFLKQVQMMFVKGEKEYLIPYIADVVKEIDIENKTIRITPMEGLLD